MAERFYELRDYICKPPEAAQKKNNGKVSMPDAATDLRTVEAVQWDAGKHQIVVASAEGVGSPELGPRGRDTCGGSSDAGCCSSPRPPENRKNEPFPVRLMKFYQEEPS